MLYTHKPKIKKHYRAERGFSEWLKDKYLRMLENETIYMANLDVWEGLLSGRIKNLYDYEVKR